jgi:hypothetical protein
VHLLVDVRICAIWETKLHNLFNNTASTGDSLRSRELQFILMVIKGSDIWTHPSPISDNRTTSCAALTHVTAAQMGKQ